MQQVNETAVLPKGTESEEQNDGATYVDIGTIETEPKTSAFRPISYDSHWRRTQISRNIRCREKVSLHWHELRPTGGSLYLWIW
jgi:hypothetical protein